MQVCVAESAFFKFLRQICTDHFRAIHANDCVYHSRVHIVSRQTFCNFLCLVRTGFQACHINVKIDMGMTCGKVSRNGMQCHMIVVSRIQFYHSCFHRFHRKIPPLTLIIMSVLFRQAKHSASFYSLNQSKYFHFYPH